jgi:hypothetical protein
MIKNVCIVINYSFQVAKNQYSCQIEIVRIQGNLLNHHTKSFDCNNCNHEVSLRLSDITNKKVGVVIVVIPPKKLCFGDNCKLCFSKSFASHEKSQNWHLNKKWIN